MFEKEPPLQPLRVPRGWHITYNDFRELDPSEEAFRGHYLTEDLLQARCDATNMLVDLGWYPDHDPDGFFQVQVYLGDFRGQQLECARSRTRAGAVELLESALSKYHFLPEKG